MGDASTFEFRSSNGTSSTHGCRSGVDAWDLGEETATMLIIFISFVGSLEKTFEMVKSYVTESPMPDEKSSFRWSEILICLVSHAEMNHAMLWTGIRNNGAGGTTNCVGTTGIARGGMMCLVDGDLAADYFTASMGFRGTWSISASLFCQCNGKICSWIDGTAETTMIVAGIHPKV
jgi:hypothetical protein